MWKALKSKNKLKFVDGSITKPAEEDSLFEAWDRCNTYIVSWLNLSLSTEIAQSVMWMNNAADIWNALKHRECDCGLDVVRKHKEDMCVVRMPRGLNDQYAVVRSQVMLMKPLPDIDAAFSLLLQQERQNVKSLECRILIASSDTKSNYAMNPQASSNTRGGRDFRSRGGRTTYGRGGRTQGYKQCIFYGKSGHTEDTCYRKHGFPPNLRTGNGGSIINNIIADEHDEKVSNTPQEVQHDSKISFSANQKLALLVLLEKQKQ
ncbi:uncharacterized protein LOC130948948 [Arachis stenosperma]|uniref:uncharacterized protein LOC130948948 n=1 Tax=Arachis stenosperma TaxID=217475 RepID=UPI0025ABED8C|nr:uncharacterized protein LOC130948948 [Arachis stenosperma]